MQSENIKLNYENKIQEEMKNIKNIYKHLQDEQSKEIFVNRLMYALTGDWKFINRILLNLPQRKALDKEVEKCMNYLDKIIVWGAGHDSMMLSRLYPDFKFRYYCDKDEKKQKEGFMGLPVLSPEELISKSDDVYVVVNTANYHCEIVDFLISNGFKKDKIFDFGAISEELYKNQYFDLNIMQPRQEELFIDGGCFDCGTDIQFIEWCGGQYNKIYAFEPDKMNYMKCLKKRDEKGISNISIYNKGLWDTATELSFTANGNGSSRVVGEQEENVITIDTVCIDDVVSEEKVSLIKLDVEGAELKALQGAQKTIKRDRPRLAVCIYHKPQDIVEILEFILSLHDDYKLYIRHYHYEYIETVVYAI